MEGLTPRLTAGRLLRRHRITEAAVEAAVSTTPEALQAGVREARSGVPAAAHPTAVAEYREDADS